MTPCPCGSGQHSWPVYDAQHVFLCHVCLRCRLRKLAELGIYVASVDDVEEPPVVRTNHVRVKDG